MSDAPEEPQDAEATGSANRTAELPAASRKARKPVLLVVIDALAPRVVESELAEGRLPHFAALMERGRATTGSSIFPSITPAATTAIATGHYPANTGILGAYWYEEQEDEVAYFGSDIWVIAKEGPGTFFEDFLVKLNEKYLEIDTIFNLVERNGMLAACLNYLCFHGPHEKPVHTPVLLSLMAGGAGAVTTPVVHGPSVHLLGNLIHPDWLPADPELKSPFTRWGFNDDRTGAALTALAAADALPDFTLAYFPENDFQSHKHTPQGAAGRLTNVDGYLGEVFDLYGGIDAFLERFAVIVTGDHAQCDMVEGEENCGIDMHELLAEFTVSAPTGPIAGDEVFPCPNMRAVQVYRNNKSSVRIRRLVEVLLADDRVDLVAWQDPENPEHYHVRNHKGHEFDFLAVEGDRSGKDGQTVTDDYGNRWYTCGNLAAVDAVAEDGRVAYGDYPNALERVAGSFAHASGAFWCSAKEGYSFKTPDTEVYEGGGSHGSLHHSDSVTQMIFAGLPEDVYDFSKPLRLVDITPICLRTLGLDIGPDPGQGRTLTD